MSKYQSNGNAITDQKNTTKETNNQKKNDNRQRRKYVCRANKA